MRRPFFGRRRVNPFSDGLPDQHAIKMCFGKRSLNKQQALQLAVHMKKHHGAPDTLGPYKCTVCKRYHVGNHESNREQR